MATELLYSRLESLTAMDAVVIATTLLGSLLGALALQKIALEGLLRAMSADRRSRE